jgi:hypothetical protein
MDQDTTLKPQQSEHNLWSYEMQEEPTWSQGEGNAGCRTINKDGDGIAELDSLTLVDSPAESLLITKLAAREEAILVYSGGYEIEDRNFPRQDTYRSRSAMSQPGTKHSQASAQSASTWDNDDKDNHSDSVYIRQTCKEVD